MKDVNRVSTFYQGKANNIIVVLVSFCYGAATNEMQVENLPQLVADYIDTKGAVILFKMVVLKYLGGSIY